MLSNKPYLLRAFYQWIVDSECTPYLLIDGEMKNVQVPQEFIEDGKIILNVSPRATRDFRISNHEVACRTSFGGVEKYISVPVQSIMAIYAMENGQGMVFEEDEQSGDGSLEEEVPNLRVVE
ncbi:MAG: ClpXP protease specificity-enhancing factor [Pseudomonadota bacterium]|nr:ClpXP protease specificity-enhancing factor [Gammaproteobacteria bacterium]MBU1558346.1 ClpXP protease specificity-enhancing factor [Gammaproteobacteria bacterium]MBU1628828.1 ClpXP protease specificity-enhancing factor [Gammaproteobacteria bacterium]MBU1926459.1 ClpXP protease specificity-enhancing factor [Gammaproteobacteria bacterium]MBU2545656.1 ClpXP protease specificity-enhancing factor [Gammaproteobacteria bacterium]